jgi:CBS domain-containing protein
MTREVMTVTEDQPVANLLTTLNALQFRHLPVTDKRKLIGLLTERDLLRISASVLLPHGKEQDQFIGQRFTVGDVMNQNVVATSADAPLFEAARRMFRDRLGCLPVVNEQNELVGLLTTSDCMRAALEAIAH